MHKWKWIKGYRFLYKINCFGQVMSYRFIKKYNERRFDLLKVVVGKVGYPIVRLCKNGVSKNFCIHRLLAETFIPNPNNYPEVNHKDSDKTNYDLENLEWVNRSQNMIHAAKNAPSKNRKVLIGDAIILRAFIDDGISSDIISKTFDIPHKFIYRVKHHSFKHLK